ncbi:MAG: HlyD family secretion protein [Deltaproteobacteria bacterium]|nr:HlyD family secretion protein [Deltaproteobacteria bacterium]
MTLNKRQRLFAAIFAVCAISLIAVYLRFSRRSAAPDFIESTGTVEATEVELTPKISGRIVKLCCKEGDSVKAGDVAVVLDAAEFKARVEEGGAALRGAVEEISEARVGLENVQSLFESAGYELEASISETARARAVADEARRNLDRAKGLFSGGYLSRKDLDAAQTGFDSDIALLNSAIARGKSAEANVKVSEANIKAARARVSALIARKEQAVAALKVLEAQLDDTVVKSPVDGLVVYRSFESGETVGPGKSIYTVDVLKDVWARIDVEETYVRRIKVGDRAGISFTGGGGKVFEGTVVEIGEVGGFATQRDVTRGHADIKTFRVKTRAENPAGLLKPGMTVNVRIYFSK